MPIIYDEIKRVFKLDTPNTTYAFHVTESKNLLHLYYGASIPETDITHMLRIPNDEPFVPATHDGMGPHSFDCAAIEFPTSGVADFREPCMQLMDKYGMSACECYYDSYAIFKGKKKLEGLPATYANSDDEVTSLEVYCKDPHNGLEITLQYSVFEKLDVITRSVKVKNSGADPIELRRLLSTCVELDSKDYDMITLYGTWARERHVQRNPLHFGKQLVDSCRGSTSHAHNNFIAIVDHKATEDYGDCYGFALCYSGSFVAGCEVNQYEKTRVFSGINPYDFSWHLDLGEEFQAPEVIMVFSASGIGTMSRTFHDVMRNNLTRGKWKDIRRPILINNWEATYFNFDTDKLLDIARESAKAGIEMLVMDDGWFGHRNDDKSSLGDWFVNENKIKGGLKHLVDEVNKLGLKFGIWFEPEMISPDSELYKAHPDWCIHIPGRPRTTCRSQLVIDFSRREVRDYIYEQMYKILSSANIEYVKWDMNRQLCEVGNEVLPPERQREIWHRYVLGVYEIQERLLTDFPDLLLENCAGGGSRFDAGMLYYSPQIWCSDDTDAIERLKIQYGTSLCYPCSCFGAHVSDSPNHCVGRITPFETRGRVAMVGTFGYELDITKISDDDKWNIRKQIEDFNKYNPLVRTGDHYRIGDPFANDRFDAWEFVAKDKSEALLEYIQVLKEPSVFLHRVRLVGLEKGRYYRHEETGRVYSAEVLMNSGFDIPSLWGDFQSYIAHFIRVED